MAIAVQSALRVGVLNPVLHASVVLVLIGGWLLGLRHALWLLLVSVGWAAILTYASVCCGWVPLPSTSGLGYWLAMSAVWIIGYVAMRLVLQSHETRLNDIATLQCRLTH